MFAVPALTCTNVKRCKDNKATSSRFHSTKTVDEKLMENFPNEMSKPTSFTTANPQILMTVQITQPAKLASAQGSSSPRDYAPLRFAFL